VNAKKPPSYTNVCDATMSSGAQILSTEYPINEPVRWAGHFVVKLSGDLPASSNPIQGERHQWGEQK
jgi:hypothetical protein